MSYRLAVAFGCLLLSSSTLFAQSNRTTTQQCGTLERLQLRFAQRPELRAKFEKSTAAFNRAMEQVAPRTHNQRMENTQAVVYIPVVFHIVMGNPNLVSDAQLQAQLDTLNKDFAGTNADSTRIPAWFKPLYGKSIIQFCLAQKAPDGNVTTGINHYVSNHPPFWVDDQIKDDATGGADSWNTDAYLNIWIGQLAGGLLGYATFPNDGLPEDQGVVIDYRTLPGGAMTGFNSGRTLTHETGHFFNLNHIWGDDNGQCWGSDNVNDTPNQGDATSGCFTGVRTDNCTSTGNGVMYQNYMDYSNDVCMVMFTTGQVSRMENALNSFRSSLLTSTACTPPVLRNFDVEIRSIDQPGGRICAPSFVPYITLRNRGTQTITNMQINISIDNGTPVTVNWTGSLATMQTASVPLPTMTTTPGNHTLTITAVNPNGVTDEDPSNNTKVLAYQYVEPVTTIQEGFEGTTFPPSGWAIVNPDASITWQRVTGIAKTGNASVKLNNFDYDMMGERDDLLLPSMGIPNGIDSAYLTFQVASAVYTNPNAGGNVWDTLQVLISTDCGKTYTSLYKKWGPNLITRSGATENEFVPNSNEWRKDSINLGNYIGQSNLLVAFRNTTGFENNIYLDDINLRTITVNPNLRREGFLVTPNPTTGIIAVQFYPQPTNLQGIQLYNDIGQLMAERQATNGGGTYYTFDLTPYAAGTYIVKVVFADRVITRRVVRL